MLRLDRIADVLVLVARDVGCARVAQRKERRNIPAVLFASKVCPDKPTNVFGE